MGFYHENRIPFLESTLHLSDSSYAGIHSGHLVGCGVY